VTSGQRAFLSRLAAKEGPFLRVLPIRPPHSLHQSHDLFAVVASLGVWSSLITSVPPGNAGGTLLFWR